MIFGNWFQTDSWFQTNRIILTGVEAHRAPVVNPQFRGLADAAGVAVAVAFPGVEGVLVPLDSGRRNSLQVASFSDRIVKAFHFPVPLFGTGLGLRASRRAG